MRPELAVVGDRERQGHPGEPGDGCGCLSIVQYSVAGRPRRSTPTPWRARWSVTLTYRGNAGAGIVQPRAKVNLSDFLSMPTNAHVPRGPFQYSVMRIGKVRDGSKVGVFLYCQQHAREWATPLTCLETAEQLLRNYAIDLRERGSWSTTSTSSSSRRPTRTACTSRCTTSTPSARR